MYTAPDGKPPILPTGPISFVRSIDEEFKGLQLFRPDNFRLADIRPQRGERSSCGLRTSRIGLV